MINKLQDSFIVIVYFILINAIYGLIGLGHQNNKIANEKQQILSTQVHHLITKTIIMFICFNCFSYFTVSFQFYTSMLQLNQSCLPLTWPGIQAFKASLVLLIYPCLCLSHMCPSPAHHSIFKTVIWWWKREGHMVWWYYSGWLAGMGILCVQESPL